jgi:t-SNARE complex subunit (syntaxin)
MSTVQEIEAAIPKLSPAEIARLRDWLDEFVEQQLELTDEVKKELDEAKRDIAAGRTRTRRPA